MNKIKLLTDEERKEIGEDNLNITTEPIPPFPPQTVISPKIPSYKVRDYEINHGAKFPSKRRGWKSNKKKK